MKISRMALLVLSLIQASCMMAIDPEGKTGASAGEAQIPVGQNPVDPPLPGVTTAQSVEIYSKTLHPLVTAQCGRCHGVDQAPLFAVADAGTAHNSLINFGLVSLSNPASSRLVQKVQAGHQGFATALATDLQTQIKAWADQLAAVGGALPAPTVVLTATFSSISTLILAPKCASCHGATRASEGIRYDTYSNTLRTVVPRNPAGSELYKSVLNGSMPEMAPPLTPQELQVINKWISDGALNN